MHVAQSAILWQLRLSALQLLLWQLASEREEEHDFIDKNEHKIIVAK